ncbi:hypothetical protein F4774DRAFT_97654 [Daldinia eschscholtzii]|nr:hypothetical protein F4774DRAFT_97654 [Daldinia eschscholtzii]
MPPNCRLTMLRVLCMHMFPAEIEDLRPLEERFLALGCAFGTITKFSLDLLNNKPSGPSYRKISGHVSVFANNLFQVVKILPRPVEDIMGEITVVWCSPDKLTKKELLPFLGVRKSAMVKALMWLKKYNHLYADVPLDDGFWDHWSGEDDDLFFLDILSSVQHMNNPEDEAAERAIYVPQQNHPLPIFEDGPSDPAGGGDDKDADEDEDENEEWAEVARFTMQTGDGDAMMDTDHVGENDAEPGPSNSATAGRGVAGDQGDPAPVLSVMTSSGFFDMAGGKSNDIQKIGLLREAVLRENLLRENVTRPGEAFSEEIIDGKLYVKVFFGKQYLSILDPHYFASIFIKLLPYGWGGPVATDEAQKEELKRFKKTNFSVQKYVLLFLSVPTQAVEKHVDDQ